MIGEMLNEKYKIEDAISESHAYEVFSALEIETGVEVAVKILKEEMAVNTERVKTFTEEIKSFASLSHPNIAEILDIDIFEDRPYVVTELVHGKALHELIKEDTIPFAETVEIIQKLTSILQFAHSNKIDQRTIKLSNVLRNDKKELTVLSFTLPRLRIAGQRTRLKSEKSGIQADLFFLGITFYELLTGETLIRRRGGINELWDNKLAKQMRMKHAELTPKQMKKVISFVSKTLTRNVSNRFESHEEFLKELADIAVLVRITAAKSKAPQLSMASQVVDALNGRMSNVNPIIPNIPKSVPLKAASNTTASLQPDMQAKVDNLIIQDYALEGSLALSPLPVSVTKTSENRINKPLNVTKAKKPKLRLLKKNKNISQTVWKSEEHHWLRNPVLFMGLCLIVMTLLVLFW